MTTNIEWCKNPDGSKGETWNILTGCDHCSDGCDNCWAVRMATRQIGMGNANYRGAVKGGRWTGKIRLLPDALDKPLHWKKPRTIFVQSMGDLFHDKVPFWFVHRVFEVIRSCPQHTFMILTKRPERMAEYATAFFRDDNAWPLPNVHLYVSIEDQRTADERIPWLLRTPGVVHGLSLEPMLGPVDLMRTGVYMPLLDHVIVGPETGPNRRPTKLDWVRSVRDQCVEAGVKFFFKAEIIDGKRISMPLLDGKRWDEMPGQGKEGNNGQE